MTTVILDRPAPDFQLDDLAGRPFALSEQQGRHHVLLVFNRGFR